MLDWSRFCRIKEIKKGWSGDKKYQVWDKSGKEFFLRISPPEKNSGREELFSILAGWKSCLLHLLRLWNSALVKKVATPFTAGLKVLSLNRFYHICHLASKKSWVFLQAGC